MAICWGGRRRRRGDPFSVEEDITCRTDDYSLEPLDHASFPSASSKDLPSNNRVYFFSSLTEHNKLVSTYIVKQKKLPAIIINEYI